MAKGMTQKSLGLKVGMSQPAIARFEAGDTGMGTTMTTLIKIATALGKRVEFTELAEPYLTAKPPLG